MPKLSKCKYCGADIYWLTDEQGNSKPVDTKKKVVMVIGTGDIVRTVQGYPLHNATCSLRQNSASSSSRRGEDGKPIRPW